MTRELKYLEKSVMEPRGHFLSSHETKFLPMNSIHIFIIPLQAIYFKIHTLCMYVKHMMCACMYYTYREIYVKYFFYLSSKHSSRSVLRCILLCGLLIPLGKIHTSIYISRPGHDKHLSLT